MSSTELHTHQMHPTLMNISAPGLFSACKCSCDCSHGTPQPLAKDFFPALPTEIIFAIASYLDINDVYSLSKVCITDYLSIVISY